MLQGVNHAGYAVGAFQSESVSTCSPMQAFYLQPGDGNYPLTGPLSLPSSDYSVATGINDDCDIVGWFAASSTSNAKGFYGVPKGKTYSNTCAMPGPNGMKFIQTVFQCNGDSTQILGLNSANPPQIVGDYVTGSGTKAVTHGFIASTGDLTSSGCSTIDDSNADSVTVVSGINDAGYMSGGPKTAVRSCMDL